jgi:hypothetical protein
MTRKVIYRAVGAHARSQSIASRSICERSSNLCSTLSTRASVPRSTLIKRLSEYLDVGAIRCLAFLGIAVFLTQAPSPNRKKPANDAIYRSIAHPIPIDIASTPSRAVHKTIALDPGGVDRGLCIAGSRVVSVTQKLLKDLHPNKHISIDSVTLCLEQTFCDGCHSTIQSVPAFEPSIS